MEPSYGHAKHHFFFPIIAQQSHKGWLLAWFLRDILPFHYWQWRHRTNHFVPNAYASQATSNKLKAWLDGRFLSPSFGDKNRPSNQALRPIKIPEGKAKLSSADKINDVVFLLNSKRIESCPVFQTSHLSSAVFLLNNTWRMPRS